MLVNKTGNVRITQQWGAFLQPKAISITYSEWVCVCLCVCVCVCVCSLSYPACNAHAPYCHLWPARSTTFFHIISQTARFSKKKKKLLNKNVFWFPLQVMSETFFILGRTERDMFKKSSGLHVQHPLFLSDFNYTWIFSTVFRKMLKYQTSWKSVQWEPSCSMRTDGRKDKHVESNRRFSQFCEYA